jgi:hypothetical protein
MVDAAVWDNVFRAGLRGVRRPTQPMNDYQRVSVSRREFLRHAIGAPRLLRFSVCGLVRLYRG